MDVALKRRLCAVAAALAAADDDEYYYHAKRTMWTTKWVSRKNRSASCLLYKELVVEDPNEYRRMLRLSDGQFEDILSRIRCRLERQTTNMRRPISPYDRLTITLRYLATGKHASVYSPQCSAVDITWLAVVDAILHHSCAAELILSWLAGESQHSLSRQFRVGHCTVNGILTDTCEAIYCEMKEEFLQIPHTEDEWLAVMDSFYTMWQFPACIGVLDGKHANNETCEVWFSLLQL